MTDDELYEIYNRTLGKVRSGTKIQNKDYGTQGLDGFRPYPGDGKLAVTIAVEDVKSNQPQRSKSELLAHIKKLLE